MTGTLILQEPQGYHDLFKNKTVTAEEFAATQPLDLNFAADDRPDMFSVGHIMAAAGINLDAPISPGNPPRRLTGCVVYVSERYSNHDTSDWMGFPKPGMWSWMYQQYVGDGGPPSPISYETSFSPGRGSEEMYEPVRSVANYDESRRLITRTGIKMVFVRGGSLGRFSFINILTQIAAGLAMLTVATTMVEQVAMRVMKRKELFRHAKYHEADLDESKATYQSIDHEIELPPSGLP